MKGISPLIATVLLIAFTVAIGGILAVWLTGYTTTTTEVVGTVTEAQVKCLNSQLTIPQVSYNSTGNWTTVFVAYERGTEDLYNLTVTILGAGNATIKPVEEYTKTNPLKPGSYFVKNITNITGVFPIERVRISAICQNVITVVSPECKRGETCMVGA